jgi:hypothetical protein
LQSVPIKEGSRQTPFFDSANLFGNPNVTSEDMEGTRQIARGFRGRAPLSLLILAVGSSLALILMDATPLDTEFIYPLFAMSSMVIVWAVIGLWSATLCIRCARQRRWKQSVLPGFLLVTSFLVALNFSPFVRGCNYLGGALRFAVTRSYYDHQVALLPIDGKPRLAVFIWGGMIWSFRGVVYDESDEIALPPGNQSAAWKANPDLGELSCGNWDARRLSSHFYLVGFLC